MNRYFFRLKKLLLYIATHAIVIFVYLLLLRLHNEKVFETENQIFFHLSNYAYITTLYFFVVYFTILGFINETLENDSVILASGSKLELYKRDILSRASVTMIATIVITATNYVFAYFNGGVINNLYKDNLLLAFLVYLVIILFLEISLTRVFTAVLKSHFVGAVIAALCLSLAMLLISSNYKMTLQFPNMLMARNYLSMIPMLALLVLSELAYAILLYKRDFLVVRITNR